MKSSTKKIVAIFVLLFVITLTLGYAYLSRSLKITGVSSVDANKFYVYFDNIQTNNENIGTLHDATIIDDNMHQTIEMSLDFHEENEKYEFTVDIVNESTSESVSELVNTLDLKIDSIIIPELEGTRLGQYMTYDVVYAEGDKHAGYQPHKCDDLFARQTYEAHGEDADYYYKRKIKVTIEVMPEVNLTDVELYQNLTLQINYVYDSIECSPSSNYDTPIYHQIIVNPNGGIYRDSKLASNKEKVLTEYKHDESNSNTYFFGTGSRANYVLVGWDINGDDVEEFTADENGYTDFGYGLSLLPYGSDSITLKAIWELEKDYVARIERDKFETVEEAFIAALNPKYTDNTIFILRDTDRMKKGSVTQETIQDGEGNNITVDVQNYLPQATNNSNVTLNLQGHTLYGGIINNGKLTLINDYLSNPKEAKEDGVGTIQYDNGIAIDNRGKFVLGENDGTVYDNNIAIIGSEYGIKSVNYENKYITDPLYIDENFYFNFEPLRYGEERDYGFYFYDGYIIGNTWAYGNYYDNCPERYAPYIDEEETTGKDKAYLTQYTGVVKTIIPCTITYKNLQKAINVTNDVSARYSYGQVIYAIREFETAQPITIKEGYKVKFDLSSFYVLFGNTVKNYGTFDILDTGDSKGYLDPSVAIENYGTLTVHNIRFDETTDANFITNYGELNLKNAHVISKKNYTVINRDNGTIHMTGDSYLLSTETFALYNDSTTPLVLDSGLIYGIYCDKGTTYLKEGLTVKNNNNSVAINNKGTSTMIVEGAEIISSRDGVYNGSSSRPTLIINSGTIKAVDTTVKTGNCPSGWLDEWGTTYIDGGDLSSSDGVVISFGGGNTYVKGATIVSPGIIASGDGGSLNVYGGTLKSLNDTVISSVFGSFNLYDGNIIAEAEGQSAITLGSWDRGNVTVDGSANIYGGYVYGDLYGIQDNSNAGGGSIGGGTIEGGTYGVYIRSNLSSRKIYSRTEDYEIPREDERYVTPANECTVYQNKYDGVGINKVDPVLIGGTYGLYVPLTNKNIVFYGGILKGQTWGYYGKIYEVPDGLFVLEDDTETINRKLYHVAYLEISDDYLRYGENTYNSLTKVSQAIIDAGDQNAIVYVTNDRTAYKQDGSESSGKNGDIKFTQTIPADASFTLDLQGYTVELSKSIINKGNITVTDSSYLGKGTITASLNIHTIQNQGTITLDSGTIKNESNSGNAINSTTAVVVNGGKLEAEGTALNSTGTFKINGGTVEGKKYAVNAAGNVTVNGGTVKSDNIAINLSGASKRHSVVNNGTIEGKVTGIYFNDNCSNGSGCHVDSRNTLTINGGTINSDKYGIHNNQGYTYIYGGTVNGKDGVYSESYLFIGDKEDQAINKESPRLYGTEYGLYVKSGFTGFYDGIIVGKNEGILVADRNAYHGTIGEIPDATILKEDDFDPITGYPAAWIESQEYFVKVKSSAPEEQEYCSFLTDESTGEIIDSEYKYCNSLQNAIDYIGAYHEGHETAILTATVLTKYNAIIPSTYDVTFDLNGHTYMETQGIINNGILTITDSSSDESGSITSSYEIRMIENNGTLNILKGNYIGNTNPISGASPTVILNNRTLYVESGTINNTSYGIYTQNGTVHIIDVNMTEDYTYNIYNLNSNVTIDGGNFKGLYSVYSTSNGGKSSTVTINDGTFLNDTSTRYDSPVTIHGGNTVIINNGTFTSYNECVNYVGNLTINNGTFTANGNGLYNNTNITINNIDLTSINNSITNFSNCTINDGSIVSKDKYAVENGATLKVLGGYLEGKDYAIYNRSSATLGTKDKNISISNPVVVGSLYGIYNVINAGSNTYGKFYFYDGILKGTTEGYYGVVDDIEEDSFIYTSNEIINDEEYITRYLYSEGAIAKNVRTGVVYNNLNTAFAEAENEDTIEFYCQVKDDDQSLTNCVDTNEDGAIETVPIYYAVSVPEGLKVTLDMKGYEVTTSQPITNKGNLTLIDSSEGSIGSFNSLTNINIIKNVGTLTINEMNLRNKTANSYLVNNQSSGTATVNGIIINSRYGITNAGTLTVNDSNITSSYTGLNNSGKMYINNSTLYGNGDNNKIVSANSNGTVEIKDSNITSYRSSGDYSSSAAIYCTQSSKVNIEDTTVTGVITIDSNGSTVTIDNLDLNGSISNNGQTTITNSTLKSSTNGIGSSPSNQITNGYKLKIEDSEIIDSDRKYIISNSGSSFELNNNNISTSNSNINEVFGIYNRSSGRIYLNNNNINIDAKSATYGLYTDGSGSVINLYNGEIRVGGPYSVANTYAAYINTGTLELGHRETTDAEYEAGELENERELDVQIDYPYLESITSGYGIGVKKVNGRFNFFDGYILASHEAKPDTTSLVELNYEAAIYINSENGFEYSYPTFIGKTYNSAQVALVNGKYYTSLQKAIDDCPNGDTIQILKNVEQSVEVNSAKDIIIHLNKNIIYGTIVNDGKLSLYNGSVINHDTNTPTIENNGTLIIGEDDGTVAPNNIYINNEKGTAIEQNGILRMNDGYVEGDLAIDGEINSTAEFARAVHLNQNNVDGVYIQELSEEAIREGRTALLFRIDPNHGSYEGSTEIRESLKYFGEVITLTVNEETPVREGFTFVGWESSDPSALNENVVTIGIHDVTVTAKWELNESAVAHIGDNYYTSITRALAAAKDRETVEVIRDTTENIVNNNNENIILNLGNHVVNGSLTNNGVITIDHGTIINETGTAITNNRILKVGTNDGNVSDSSIIIIGKDIGIKQNETFYMYDGIVEGDVALDGSYTGLSQGYFFNIGFDDDRQCQKAYLFGSPDNVYFATKDGGTIYYFNLQNAINASRLTGYKIYAIQDSNLTYEVTIPENTNIVLDLGGYTITSPNNIINNGNFTIMDGYEVPGTLNVTNPIDNKGTLSINKIAVNATGTKNVINNTGDLSLTSTKITAGSGYAVRNEANATLSLSKDTILIGTSYALYNASELTLDKGKIYGILNENSLTLSGEVNITPASNVHGVVNRGNLNINGATITTTGSSAHGIVVNTKTSVINMTDGTITSQGYGIHMQNVNATFNMSGGTITSTGYGIYQYNDNWDYREAPIKSNITGGTITSTGSSGTYQRASGDYRGNNVVTVDGGHIIGAARGVYIDYYGTFNLKSGTIETTHSSSADYPAVWQRYGTTNITGGTVKADTTWAIRQYTNSYVNMSGGKIEAFNGIHTERNTSSRLNITGGEISVTDTYGIYLWSQYGNTHTVKDVYIHGGAYGILMQSNNNDTQDTWNIENVTIEARTDGIVITNYNGNHYPYTVNFKSGTINAGRYGILLNNTKATINIGDSSNEVNYNNPSIVGETMGVYQQAAGTINYYDGVIKGKEHGLSGIVTKLAIGHEVALKEEIISGEEYQVNYLKEKEKYLQVNEEQFNSFEDALNYINENLHGIGTIKFILGTTVNEVVTIPKEYDVTIDMNGQSEIFTQAIMNYGTLTMTDSTDLKNGSINNAKTTLFGNYGTMNIEAGNYTTTAGNGISTSNPSVAVTFNMSGGTLTASGYGLYQYNDSWDYREKTIKANITGGTITSTGSSAIYQRASGDYRGNNVLTVDGGHIIGAARGVFIEYYGTLNLKSGTIESTHSSSADYPAIYQRCGNINISGGVVKADTTWGIRQYEYSTVNMSGGKIEAFNGIHTERNSSSKLNITGGEISVTDTHGIYLWDHYGNTHTIKDVYIHGGTYGIYMVSRYNSTQDVWNIENVTIEARTDGIVMTKDGSNDFQNTVNFKSGTITAGRYGINIVNATAVVNIGVNDAEVNYNNPLIVGETIGVYQQAASTVNYYDGIIKGQEKGLSATLTKMAVGHVVGTTTETINDVEYQVNFLQEKEKFLQVNEEQFNSFEDALNYINENLNNVGTIKCILGTTINEVVTIPLGYDITIDVNGQSEIFTQAIMNYGTLTMTDSTDLKDGSFSNSKTTLFGNYGTMNIEAGNYISTAGNGISTSNPNVNVVFNMSGGTLTASGYGLYQHNNNWDYRERSIKSTITGGTITSTGSSAIYQRAYGDYRGNNVVTIDGGHLIGAARGVFIEDYGTLNLKSGTIESTHSSSADYPAIYQRCGTLNITGGTVKADNTWGIRQYEYSTINMSGGKIEAFNGIHTERNSSSKLNITGGEISVTDTHGIYLWDHYGNTHTIKDVYIHGGAYGIYMVSRYNSTQDVWNIENVTIEARTDGIVMTKDGSNDYQNTVNFKSGTITAGRYGINVAASTAVLNVGINDETVSQSVPLIQGEEYGIYAPVGTINYYDGNSRGITAGIEAVFNTLPTGYEVRESAEDVSGVTYQSAKLYEMEDIIENKETGEKYVNIQDALDEVENGQTLRLIEDATLTYAITMSATSNFIFDLNGHDLTTTKAITNNGILEIIDSKETHKTIKNIKSMYVITNTKNLTITGINIVGYQGINTSAASGSLTIDDVVITTSNTAINSSGPVTVTDCTVTSGGGYGLYLNSAQASTITDSTFTCTANSIYNNSNGNITITNSTIKGTAIDNRGTGKMLFTDATLEGSTFTNNSTGKIEATNTVFKLSSILNNNSTGIIEYTGGSYTGRLLTKGKTTFDGTTISYTYSGGDNNIHMINSQNEFIIKNCTVTYTLKHPNRSNYNFFLLAAQNKLTSENNKYYYYDDSTYRYASTRIISTTGSQDSTSTNDTLTMNTSSTNLNYIGNNYPRAIYHSSTGTFTAEGLKITETNGEEDIAIISGESAGDVILRNVDITVSARKNAYGLYNRRNMVLESGTVKVNGINTYGVYITSTGVFEAGLEDGSGTDSAVVSITDPYIIGKGTTFGYGIKNAEGIFNYYDGKIAGTTNALAELPTKTELDYSPIRYFDGIENSEYVQLEYIKSFDGYIASVGDLSFGDLQSALSFAPDGSTVKLLKDTNEYVTSNGNDITLDLNNNVLNGKIINNGTLRIDNGTITNIAGSAVDNLGTLTLGIFTDLGDVTDPILIGTTSAIVNEGDLYFHGGILKAYQDVIINTGNVYPLATFKVEEGTEESYITNYLVDDPDYPLENQYAFGYTGKEEYFIVPATGDYTIEAWGAQGGRSWGNGSYREYGGYGAYATGKITLNRKTILYINAGGAGSNGVAYVDVAGGYNGGGSAIYDHSDDESAGGGGGATHVAFTSGLLQDLESKKNQVIIVAAGGGGSAWLPAGHGGGFESKAGTNTTTNIATQTTGYAFGLGQSAPRVTSSTKSYDGVAGAGGGWYGGYTQDVDDKASGTGGSSYIGYSGLTDKAMYCYNCTTSDEVDTKTISVSTSSADPISNKPKQGNGYVLIKLDKSISNVDNPVVGTKYEFEFTNREETFVVPKTGIYKLKVWGAQGGSYNDTYIGGYGGYSEGEVYLENGQILYINVGEQGYSGDARESKNYGDGGYNGGGTRSGYSCPGCVFYSSGGGGATHIATSSGLLDTFENKQNELLIVAGGGGGNGYVNTGVNYNSTLIASGGGISGNRGQPASNNKGGASGTQTSGAAFGKGGNCGTAGVCDGGGGGYYGGGYGYQDGGGGSGYIGNTLLSNKHMTCYNCETSDDESTKTTSTTNTSEEAIDNTAKKGNGYAIIELVQDYDSYCEQLIGTSYDFDYINGEEEFNVTCPGMYKLETWGAQGGSYDATYYGGYGSYSTGRINLNANEKLYINVGGAGTITSNATKTGGYNGGGSASTSNTQDQAGTGGGATSIATRSGLLSTLEDYKDKILMVSGGGGGAYYFYKFNSPGSSAGGYKSSITTNGTCSDGRTLYVGLPATQTEPGTNNACGTEHDVPASFGQGGSSSAWYAGGGGGYYGGGYGYAHGANGGSGYLNPSLTNKHMTCYDCEESTDDLTMTYTVSTLSTGISSTAQEDYVKSGNGYARITYLSHTQTGEAYVTTYSAPYDSITISTPRENVIVFTDSTGVNTTKLNINEGERISFISSKSKYSGSALFDSSKALQARPEHYIYWYGLVNTEYGGLVTTDFKSWNTSTGLRPTVTYNDDGTISYTHIAESGSKSGGLEASSLIDLTNFEKVNVTVGQTYVDVKVNDICVNGIYSILAVQKNGSVENSVNKQKDIAARIAKHCTGEYVSGAGRTTIEGGTVTLDVSDLTGNFNVGVQSSLQQTEIGSTIKAIWLE